MTDTATETDVHTGATDSVDAPPPSAAVAGEATSPEVPIHLAVCGHEGCGVRVTYRPIASDPGFFILERAGVEMGVAIQAGPTGMLTCPHGHGELTLADEQLAPAEVPVQEAITQAAAALDAAAPAERRIPFPVPDFNHAGALHDLFRMRHDIKAQEAKVEKARDRFKKEKDDLDEMNVKLGVAIDDYEKREAERRYEQERRAQGLPETGDPRLVRCAWEQRNPGQRCPACADARFERKQAPGSEGHAVEVRDFLRHEEIERCVRELATIPFLGITAAYLEALPLDQLDQVQAWASDAAEHPDERERWMEGGVPPGLGRPHVAGAPGTTTTDGRSGQHCKTCGGDIHREGETAFPEDAFVGTDCPGAEQDHARAPRRHKKAAPKPTPKRKAK